MAGMLPVRPGDDVMLVTDVGRLIRLPADQVRLTGRSAMGVTLFRLDGGESVTSVFPVVRTATTGRQRRKENPKMSEAGRAGPRVGLYPGTFDPVTNGHLDVIGRAARLIDRLVVGGGLERRQESAVPAGGARRPGARRDGGGVRANRHAIEVRPFDGLLMHFAEAVGASVIVRGLRAVSDFDYEFAMAGMNYRLNPDIEIVFLMASERHQFIQSRFVKEVAQLGGDISSFVPALTLQRTLERLARTSGHDNRERDDAATDVYGDPSCNPRRGDEAA